MPSKPQPLSQWVLMEHPRFGQVRKRRDQLPSLSPAWKRAGAPPVAPPPEETEPFTPGDWPALSEED